MPRAGEKFVNAVGVEVEAHGGSTPASSHIRGETRSTSVANGTIAMDVFGREYDTAVPVFFPTGTRFVIDRLAGGRPSGPTSGVIDIDSLTDVAMVNGHHPWPEGEIGEPPQWWLDANPEMALRIAPGYGTGTDPYPPPPEPEPEDPPEGGT